MVFAVRVCGFDHWYANFGRYSASVAEYPPQRGITDEVIPPCFGEAGRLVRMNIRTHQAQVLLEEGLWNRGFVKEQTDLPLLVRDDDGKLLGLIDVQDLVRTR